MVKTIGGDKMYSKEDLLMQLRRMPVSENDTVMVHSSMKAIGNVVGGAQTVLDVLVEYFEPGLLLIPTHTWNMNTGDVFDPRFSKTCIGILPDLAVKHPKGVRSLHPTHSVVAFGKRAKEYIKGEIETNTPGSPNGVWGRLYNEGAKILLIGVGQDKNTFIHSVEEMNNTPDRLSKEPVIYKLRIDDGKIMEKGWYVHLNSKVPDISHFYTKFEPCFNSRGSIKYSSFGDAKVQVCSAKDCADVLLEIFSKADHDLCIDETPVPEAYYM